MGERFTVQALQERRVGVQWLRDSRLVDSSLERRCREHIFLISDGKVLDQTARMLANSRRRCGWLVVLFCPRSRILPCLHRAMDRVIYVDAAGACTPEQTIDMLEAPDRHERMVGALADSGTDTITFWSGDLLPLVVRADWIRQRVPLTKLTAGSWRIVDGGRAVESGAGRLPAHEILCEYDAEFRREFRRRQWAADESLGGRVRVLRQKMGLRREDFPGIDAKTVARIERNEIRRPQRETLRLIGQTLGLSDASLGRLSVG